MAVPALLGRDLISRNEYDDFDLEFEWRVAPGANSGVRYFVDESVPHRFHRYLTLALAGLGLLLFLVALVRRNRMARLVCAALAVTLGFAGGEALRRLRYMSTGPEMQILDDTRHPDGRNPLTRAGALYGRIPPAANPALPAGQWNTGRIVVDGAHAEHWINGIRVVSYRFEERPGRRIALQHHRDEVWYRNFRIRRLSTAP